MSVSICSIYLYTCINYIYTCPFLVSIPEKPRVSQKAYNRWFVAYTLIKNPQLAKAVQNGKRSPFPKTDDV